LAFGQANQSVQIVEAVLSRAGTTQSARCGSRAGQAGGGPEGANFAGCDSITGDGLEPALGEPNTGNLGGLGDTGVQ
jgi:hypothetical protein